MKKLIQLAAIALTLSMSSAVFAEMVNINTADAKILDTKLNGVGAKKAEAIVAYRTEHGGFKSLEEIKEVSGIGDGIYKKIEADISLTEGLGADAAASATTAKVPDASKAVATKDSAPATPPAAVKDSKTDTTPAASATDKKAAPADKAANASDKTAPKS